VYIINPSARSIEIVRKVNGSDNETLIACSGTPNSLVVDPINR